VANKGKYFVLIEFLLFACVNMDHVAFATC